MACPARLALIAPTLFASALVLPLVTPRLALAQDAPAEEAPPDGDPYAHFPWQREGVGKLGTRGVIALPGGFKFVEGQAAVNLVEFMGNLTSRRELGLIGPEDLEWFVVFYFDETGYIKDDEKDELDADEMAESMRQDLEASNEERRNRGLDQIAFDGWVIPPRYNEATNQLEWANRLRGSAGGISVNYNTRVLGREGVMRLILVTDPELLQGTLPKFKSMMEGFSFVEGQRYAEYRPGDKIAEYGLAALVVGVGTAAAAKTGLLGGLLLFFKKGFKFIVIGVVAVGGFIAKLFGGRKE